MNESLDAVLNMTRFADASRSAATGGGLPNACSSEELFAPYLFTDTCQQSVFRALMNAFANPGRIQSLPQGYSAMHAILLCLVDSQVSFSDPCYLLTPDMHRQLEGQAAVADEADYVIAPAQADPSRVIRAPRIGTLESPELSSTVILETDMLCSEDVASSCLRLEGPGIQSFSQVSLGGIHPGWMALRESFRIDFPMGLDFVVTSANRFIALPRTTRISGAI